MNIYWEYYHKFFEKFTIDVWDPQSFNSDSVIIYNINIKFVYDFSRCQKKHLKENLGNISCYCSRGFVSLSFRKFLLNYRKLGTGELYKYFGILTIFILKNEDCFLLELFSSLQSKIWILNKFCFFVANYWNNNL